MPRITLPNSVSLHSARAFLDQNDPFKHRGGKAVLHFHKRWAHLDPFALALLAAWGRHFVREGYEVQVKNLGRHADYAARMRLFQHLNVDYDPGVTEHEEAGRFLPLTVVSNREQLTQVIADVSALLHLQDDPDSLAAVQYCVSELLRNVLEHSGSRDGAVVCAHRYTRRPPHRVTLAVADCGQGIARHLGQVRPEALKDDAVAIGLAMQPGVTGARPGLYGTPENAGAGLFITRCIAKGTGGYFFLYSGRAAYRLRRTKGSKSKLLLYIDPYDEPKHDRWMVRSKWQGTIVAVEICTEKIGDFQGFFQWIRKKMPTRVRNTDRINFT